MKILYLTVPSFFDLDVSLVRELSTFVDVRVVLIVSPQSKKSSAFSMEKLFSKCCLLPARECEEMNKYGDIIDLSRWSIANNPDNSFSSCIKLSGKIKDFIKSNHFDLIHTTTSCKTALFLTPFLYRFPHTLFTVHDPISHKKTSLFENLFRRKMFYKANENILLLSRSLLDRFCEKYGVGKNNIYFSSLSIYDILTHFAISKNDYGSYVLFFGRIEKYKGVDLLIDAYEKSDLPSNGVKLIIAGKGNIDHKNTESPINIVFINRFVENDELANLISHAKYVVLPYISATQSGCVMSAFALNKPVLATDVGDFPNVVKNGCTGMICKANDVDAICEAMNKMEHVDLSEMELNIKRKYQEKGPFSWYRIAEALCGIYKEIVSK